MHAVIMAGGKGRRLMPYTTVLPKPLMPVGDRPILDVILRQLVRAGIESISISVGHLGGLLESWVRAETDIGVPLTFLYEDEPLGTAGALGRLNHPSSSSGTLLAMNGDILTTLDFGEFADFHAASGRAATMAVRDRLVTVEYGVVHSDERGAVTALEEKPELAYTVSMGIYSFEPQVLELIEPGERIDFPDLLTRAMNRGLEVGTFAFDGYWRDIGNREDYEAALADFEADPDRF